MPRKPFASRAAGTSAPLAMALKDVRGRFIVVNRQFEKRFGLREEDVRYIARCIKEAAAVTP